MSHSGILDSDLVDDSDLRRPPSALTIACLAICALVFTVLAMTEFLGKPHLTAMPVSLDLGQPPASIPLRKTIASDTAGPPTGLSSQPVSVATSAVTAPTVSPANSIAKRVVSNGALIADPALIENTTQGPLPRIADDGRKPMTAYAPPVSAVSGPRIAVVVTGLGMNSKVTQLAIDTLPPAVTLGFVPFADSLQQLITAARARGHEVLLEVPMEPYDFPDSDPGPHALRTGSADDANINRLSWVLTRATGYTGVTNFLGSRFLSDSAATSAVMTFLARRGLYFFDGGAAQHSVVPDVAKQANAPFAQSIARIDAVPDDGSIDQQLSALETAARSTGNASGTAGLYPENFIRIAAWAKGLKGRGFALVPASAIVQSVK